MLKPVSGTRLSHQVQRQLQDYIVKKRLPCGDCLPGERELSTIFNVSRTVVREALRALESMGWIEVKQGKGAIIKGITPPVTNYANRFVQDPGFFKELMDVRCLLEVKSAALAALNHSESDLDEMASLLDEMKVSMDSEDWEKFALIDVEFHHVIVKATRNRVLQEMMTHVTAPLLDSRHATVVGLPGRSSKVHTFHLEIFQAIAQSDPRTSAVKMQEHLETALTDFESAWQGKEEESHELHQSTN